MFNLIESRHLFSYKLKTTVSLNLTSSFIFSIFLYFTWWTPEKKGHLPVGDGLLGKIVVDDQGVLSVVPEVLAHGGGGVGGEVLEGSGVSCGGDDHDGVLHRVCVK